MAQHHALDQRVVKALAHPLRVRLLARQADLVLMAFQGPTS